MAVSSHLRVTSVYVSHLRLVGEPHTVGCLPMCCPLIHCMAAFHCEDVLCLEGFSAQSPGSWQGGSWVSALLSGLFAGHLRKLVFCVCFCARSRNSVASSASPHFFSSSLAVNALWHGPDSDISGEKGGTQRNWPVPVKMANHHTKPQQHIIGQPPLELSGQGSSLFLLFGWFFVFVWFLLFCFFGFLVFPVFWAA